MLKRIFLKKMVLVLCFLLVFSAGTVYADQDWDEIVAKAKEEGEVYTYGTSGRMTRVGAVLEEKYGIKLKHVKLSMHEITDRIVREQNAGIYEVDLIMAEDMIGTSQVLLPNGYVRNYIPPMLETVIAEKYKNPFIFLFQSRALVYNTDTYNEFPIKNIWQLTTEEWKGKFILRDPEITPTTISFFAEVIDKADLMADIYKEYFGEEIRLTTPNAGWEFIKRLAKNDVVTLKGDTAVAEAIGTPGEKTFSIGLTTVGKLRYNETKGYSLGVIEGVEPVIGYFYPAYGLIAKNAPHPNAAKLLVRVLLSDRGANAWTQDEGCFSTNPNVSFNTNDPVGGLEEWKKVAWPITINNSIKYSKEIYDFWVMERDN